jgi:ABC-type uncharacterized transport system ATPase subunit
MEYTFVSYSRADSTVALKLASELRQLGANIWLDQLDIQAGLRWDAEIEKALHDAACILILLSPTSVISNNVLDELSFALEMGKTVIPVMIMQCSLPFRIRRFQYIDLTAH